MSRTENAKRKNYFSREILLFNFAGMSLSDDRGIFYKIYGGIVFYIFNFAYMFVALYGMYGTKISEEGENISYNLCVFMANVMIVTTMVNRKRITSLLIKLEEEPFLPDLQRGGAKEETEIANWYSIKKLQGLVFYVGITIFIGSGVVYTFIMNLVANNPNELKFFFGPLTILNVTNFVNFEMCWCYQVISVTSVAMKSTTIMVLMYGILSYACVHLQILQRYLNETITNDCKNNIDANANNKCSPQSNQLRTLSWEYLQPILRRAISYHLKILEVIAEVEKIYSVIIFLLYFAMLVALSVILYAISLQDVEDPRTLTLIISAGAMYGFLLPICYWGEQIAHETEQVAIAAYEGYSVDSDLRFQKGLMLIIARSQKSVRLRAGSFVEMSMITYGWILRTAFSYFMVIRNMNAKS